MIDFNKYNDVSDAVAMSINIATSSGLELPNSKSGISLKKSTITLDKSLDKISLAKKVDLCNHKAKVCVAMDYSRSMSKLYKDGTVQAIISRLMPIALMFDDNCELDIWIFDEHYVRMEPMTISNFEDYVTTEILSKGIRMGATSYAPVLDDIIRHYFVEQDNKDKVPTFVIFITDGANDDKRPTNDIIKKSSELNMFIQFIGIGKEKFDYLERLDGLKGRPVDNTGFVKIEDIDGIKDNELYEKVIEQYPDWLKAKGLM